jgi:hypothetical protein
MHDMLLNTWTFAFSKLAHPHSQRLSDISLLAHEPCVAGREPVSHAHSDNLQKAAPELQPYDWPTVLDMSGLNLSVGSSMITIVRIDKLICVRHTR